MNLTKTPHGYEEIVRTFGDARLEGFEARHIKFFDLPFPLIYGKTRVWRARAHELAIPNFLQAFANVMDRGLQGGLTHYSGIYSYRPQRGAAHKLSTHAWGIAIDVMAHANPRGARPVLDSRIVKAFEDAGFVWGGRFKVPDGMHFQLAADY